MRLITRILSSCSHYINKVDKIRLRNFAKALSQEHVTALHPETLTGRILHYLNIDNKQCPTLPKHSSEILRSVRQDVNHLQKLSTNEMINFSSMLINQSITGNELLLILKDLDFEYNSRLSQLSTEDILKILNVFMNITPNRITEFKFYKHSVKVLFDSLPTLNKKELLQLIFYIGLKKKCMDSQLMLRQCMRSMDNTFIGNLTSEELCIICNASFKTSTKIVNRTLLDTVRRYINDNLCVLKDGALFITLVKTLRHNRYQDDDLLSTVSCAMFFNKTFTLYSFPMMCHIMAMFADYFYYDEKLFKMFARTCLEQLNESNFISKKSHPMEQLRGKDIKRFLWILSMFSDLKLVSQSDIKDVIIPKLIERINAKEFERDVDSLIEITLYLWMLNYRPYELVPYVLSKRNLQLLTVNSKTNSRLNLLLYAISCEDPDLAKKIPVKPTSIPSVFSTYQLQKRPLIQRLLKNLKVIMKELGLSKFEITQEIPHLNIIGITGYRNEVDKVIYIEVLDDYTRIKNVDDVPVGLMALKLRLLDGCEEGLLTVSQKDVEEMSDADLTEYLLDEIKLIC